MTVIGVKQREGKGKFSVEHAHHNATLEEPFSHCDERVHGYHLLFLKAQNC
jgi:hypothetical protein